MDVVPTSKRLENYLKLTHKRRDYELLIPMELTGLLQRITGQADESLGDGERKRR